MPAPKCPNCENNTFAASKHLVAAQAKVQLIYCTECGAVVAAVNE